MSCQICTSHTTEVEIRGTNVNVSNKPGKNQSLFKTLSQKIKTLLNVSICDNRNKDV